MKIALSVFLFSLFPYWVMAQSNSYNYYVPEFKLPDSDSKIVVNEKGDSVLVVRFQKKDIGLNTYQDLVKTYKSTPFFANKWHNGEIVTDNEKRLPFIIAYNIENGVVYLVRNTSEVATLMRPKEFSVMGHTFKKIQNRYFEVVHEGRTQLLKEYECKLQLNNPIIKTGYETEGGSNDYEGEYIKSVTYYLNKDGKLKYLPLGRKIFSQFGVQQKEVEEYAESNKLNPKTESGLLAIFKHFDTLHK
ncbi:hypothetical protein [Runella slithyformis]|nr:hypothetical protein [Runella slithyformis]